MRQKVILLIIGMILLASSVLSIGVAPSRNEIYFESGSLREDSFRILNNEHKEMTVTIVAKGELADYVIIDNPIVKIQPGETEKIITYKISMPMKLSPGVHSVEIVAVESGDTDNNILVAAIGVIHKLNIRVAYPDQYLEGILFVGDSKPGEVTSFTVSIANVGNKDLSKVKGQIVITGPDGNGIANIQTNSVVVGVQQKSKLVADWIANVNPGTYHVLAIIDYDNSKILMLEKDFDIGEPLIDIEEVRVTSFKLGAIAKFDIRVANKWNRPMPDVYASTDITTPTGSLVEKFKTSTITLPSSGKSELNFYWDTKDVEPSDYLISVKANYLGRVKEKTFEMKVKQNEIIITSPSITGQVSKDQPEFKFGNTTALFIVGAIALLILIRMTLDFVLKIRSDGPKPVKIKTTATDRYPELSSFIKTKLKEGYTREALRESLMKKGWNRDIIDEEMLEAEDEINLGK